MKSSKLKKIISIQVPVGAAADMLPAKNPIEDHMLTRMPIRKLGTFYDVSPTYPELRGRWNKAQKRNKNILHPNNPNA